MNKRIAIYANVPDGTNPSDLLDEVTAFIEDAYGIDDESSDVAIIDNYLGEE